MQFDLHGNGRSLTKGVFIFCSYISRDKKYFYTGTENYNGLWQTTTESLDKGNPVWNKIDSSKGINLHNILTITEDSLGRIWMGHRKRGVAIYDPVTNTAKTWLIENKETAFGGFSSLTDKYGTVWIGSDKQGLWYYNEYSKEASPANCKNLNHPLLNSGNAITALTIYQDWLVISAYDKMLLLNLDSFHYRKKIILRYLNPQEANFSSFTEQNTLITARKDSTIWFSTSDMLYQWDIKNWLGLNKYKVDVNAFIKAGNKERKLTQNNPVFFEPGFNSFDIHVQYLSPDNMPRYTRAALIREGDSVLMPSPSLQSVFNIKNIGSGQYQFILEIFEADGTTTQYIYPITIKKFLWQQWWFWALASSLVIAVATWLFNLRRKRQLAEQKTKTKEAELLSYKSEQEKKLANLQLVTLSSQFRPHFILNALNTIGAQMDDKPETESVLSRLGESVNIIFNHAQQQKVLHSFENEWMLVKNIIHIHTLMYLKQLKVNWPPASIVESVKELQLPLGLLQIPVENALLHGLSNKEESPWLLTIVIEVDFDFIKVVITDNGVGRDKV